MAPETKRHRVGDDDGHVEPVKGEATMPGTELESRTPVASWNCLLAYAEDQEREVAAGRGPRRAPEIDERYRRYACWLADRGQTGSQYLVTFLAWRSEHGGPTVALEPNIVAYTLEADTGHWNLWYHPATVPGSADLDMQPGAEVFVTGDAGERRRGHIRVVNRIAHDANETYEVTLESGEVVKSGRSGLTAGQSQERWAAVLRHTRIFLPSLRGDEVVIFQNIPQLRSVPEIAHAHIFIRPQTPETAAALRQMRTDWRLRSPWAEHERLGGRGREVGWPEN